MLHPSPADTTRVIKGELAVAALSSVHCKTSDILPAGKAFSSGEVGPLRRTSSQPHRSPTKANEILVVFVSARDNRGTAALKGEAPLHHIRLVDTPGHA